MTSNEQIDTVDKEIYEYIYIYIYTCILHILSSVYWTR